MSADKRHDQQNDLLPLQFGFIVEPKRLFGIFFLDYCSRIRGHTIPSTTGGWRPGRVLGSRTRVSALRLGLLMHSDMTNSTVLCVFGMEKVYGKSTGLKRLRLLTMMLTLSF